MNSIWTILGLEPTEDISAIKRAYAEKARLCHPEEDPEGFLQLRQAYQAALACAEGGTPPEGPPSGPEEPEDEGWNLSESPKVPDEGPNPFADHPAAKAFLELYTGKQRKNPQAWLDYFTSGDFLDAAWERRFAALLLEHVTRAEYPVPREFLTWLCVAYRFKVLRMEYRNPDGSARIEYQFQMDPGAQFSGQEYIFEIGTKGPPPRDPKGNELAVRYSFQEYRRMVRMAEDGGWGEKEIALCSQIIGCYTAGYISDKCRQRGDMDHERHPAGVRLITHFFRREGLPEELYRLAWEKLDLKTALMGRAKILYGPLRELVLKRLPGLAEQPKASYAKLRTDFSGYAVGTYKAGGERAQATEEDIRKTDAFFSREDFRQALLDRRFVEEEMLHTWVEATRCDYFLKCVIRFYEEHETAPCAQRVIDRARDMLSDQALADRLLRDREAKVPKSGPTLKNAPFFRHWLNTGFYNAQDRDTGRRLLEYLNAELPYLPEWSQRFLEEDAGSRPVVCALGEDTVEIRFHLRYMEFFRNNRQIYRSCLPWKEAAALESTDAFFFLLPVVLEAYDQYDAVKAEILRRLKDTAAPKDGRAFIAGCLADQVCALPPPDAVGQVPAFEEDEPEEDELEETEREVPEPLPPESVLPFEVFGENTELLYVCVWFQRSRTLVLFQQTSYGRQLVEGGRFSNIGDAQTAEALAKRLVEDQLHPRGFPLEALKTLPEAVYAQWDYAACSKDKDRSPLWGAPVKLLGEAVTREKLEELLTLFSTGRVERMEWSWRCAFPLEEAACEPCRSLVLMKSGGWYACLYFDDFRAESYALLEKPELYGLERSSPEFVNFRQGRLFRDVLHENFFTIRRHLEKIFSQVSGPDNVKFMAGRIWSYAVNVDHGRVKYNLDKQLLGGFPMERAHNRPDAPFYFSVHPNAAVLTAEQGGVETLEVTEGNRLCLQEKMSRFLGGGYSKLRLTWGRQEGRRRHIVLLQDGGRFLMAWIQEEKRKAEFHVADRWTYLDVEGKKYPKDTFGKRVTPAYLIHGLIPLRNALDLLLANLDHPERVTGPIGEYAEEKPVKPRPYEVLLAELAEDEAEGEV